VRGVGPIVMMLVPFSLRTAIPAKTVHSGNPFDRTIGFPLLGRALKESTMSCATASAAAHPLVMSTYAPFFIFSSRVSSRVRIVWFGIFTLLAKKKIFQINLRSDHVICQPERQLNLASSHLSLVDQTHRLSACKYRQITNYKTCSEASYDPYKISIFRAMWCCNFVSPTFGASRSEDREQKI
jgi:hypothetical protein